MEEDGACLFRAISIQLYGDQEMHDLIRQRTMDYIFQNREYFAQFITEGELEASFSVTAGRLSTNAWQTFFAP